MQERGLGPKYPTLRCIWDPTPSYQRINSPQTTKAEDVFVGKSYEHSLSKDRYMQCTRINAIRTVMHDIMQLNIQQKTGTSRCTRPHSHLFCIRAISSVVSGPRKPVLWVPEHLS